MPTPGNHGVGSVTPGDPTRAQKGIISQALSSPICSRMVLWPRNLFSHSNIPKLDGAGSFISEKGLDTQASTSVAGSPLWPPYSSFTLPIELISIEELSTRVLELFDLQKVSS